jgi:hypothetical protein
LHPSATGMQLIVYRFKHTHSPNSFWQESKNEINHNIFLAEKPHIFASVAARRIRTSWVSYDDRLEGKSWVEKFQKTVIDRERYIEHQPIRKDIHLARGELEKLAWSTFGLLYRKYQGIKLKTDLPLSIQAFDSIWTQFNDVYEWLTGDAFSELNDDNVFCCQYSKQAYKIAHTYLLRQMGGIGLHLELLLAPELYDGHENSFIEDCLTLLEEPLSNEYSECLPLSILEKGLIAAARKTLGKAQPNIALKTMMNKIASGLIYGELRN